MAKTKSEITAQVLAIAEAYATLVANAPECYEAFSVSEVRSVLDAALKDVPPGIAVRTCDDFADLCVGCCETCHCFDPHYELALIDIESGGNAWICCALNPLKHAEREKSFEYQEIQRLFNSDVTG
jgi:hypothetical protein